MRLKTWWQRRNPDIKTHIDSISMKCWEQTEKSCCLGLGNKGAADEGWGSFQGDQNVLILTLVVTCTRG